MAQFTNARMDIMQPHYPALRRAPHDIGWAIFCTAIIQSGTHSSDEIREAVAKLKLWYQRSDKQ